MPHIYANIVQLVAVVVFGWYAFEYLSPNLTYYFGITLVFLYYISFEILIKLYYPTLYKNRTAQFMGSFPKPKDLFYMSCLGLIYSATYVLPLFLASPSDSPILSLKNVSGLIIFVIGMVLSISSGLTNKGMHIFIKNEDDHEICVSGIYKFCRHPFYLGQIIMHLGFATIVDVRLFFLTAVLIFITLHRSKYEEQYLEKFKIYKDYQKRCKYRIIWPIY